MAVSLNTKAIYKTKANLFNGGLGFKNGDILIGDRAFEFYNHQNPESYLQIPWDTKQAGTFQFISSDAGRTLKMMRDFIGNDKIVKTEPLFSLKKLFKK